MVGLSKRSLEAVISKMMVALLLLLIHTINLIITSQQTLSSIQKMRLKMAFIHSYDMYV